MNFTNVNVHLDGSVTNHMEQRIHLSYTNAIQVNAVRRHQNKVYVPFCTDEYETFE